MTLKYMLDTNIAIYVIKHRPLELLNVFNSNSGRMCISAVTLAELLHGVEKSERPERNLAAVEDFSARLDVLPYGGKAAAHYGEIRASLERKDTPIGVNDLHRAAHSRSEGLILVTKERVKPRRFRAGKESANPLAFSPVFAYRERNPLHKTRKTDSPLPP